MSTTSWASARNGKWHKSVSAEPDFTKQAMRCGVSFRPLNVTWDENPNTRKWWFCKHCTTPQERDELDTAWAERNHITLVAS